MTKTVGLGFEPTDIAADDEHVWVVGGYDHVLWRVTATASATEAQFRRAGRSAAAGFERGPGRGRRRGRQRLALHGDEVTELDPATGEVRARSAAGGRWHTGDRRRRRRDLGRRQHVARAGAERSRTGRPRRRPRVDLVRLLSDPSEDPVRDQAAWVAVRFADAVWELDPGFGLVQRTIPRATSRSGSPSRRRRSGSRPRDEELRRVDVRSGETELVVPIGHTVEDVARPTGRVFVTVRGP